MAALINKLFQKLRADAFWEELKPVNQIGLKMCCIGSGAQHQNVRSGVQYQNGFCKIVLRQQIEKRLVKLH